MSQLEGEIKQSLWNFLFGSRAHKANAIPVKARDTGVRGYWRGVPYPIIVYEAVTTETRVVYWKGAKCTCQVAVIPNALPPSPPSDTL